MKTALFWLLILFTNFQIFAQSEQVASIEIRSSWSGLAPSQNSTLTIKQKKGKFSGGGKKIDARLIDELLKQISSEEKRTLETLGITQAWLDANAVANLPDRLKNSLPSEKEFFMNAFRNIKLVEKIVPRIFGTWTNDKGITTYKYSTDDYPEFEMTIRKTDGSYIRRASMSQTLFMFDNPRLGRAIAALLPKNFANRERLNGDSLGYEIAKEIYDEIEEDLEALETENRFGTEIARLKERYKIRKSVFGGADSIDTGTPFSAYRTGESKKWNFRSWDAELQRKDLPPNVTIGFSLPYKENKLIGFDAFEAKIDGIVARVISVSWLAKAIAEKPDTEFEIRFVEDRSLSRKARESFLEDLQAFGANALSAEILDNIDDSVFLRISEKSRKSSSLWLILPDGRAIVWQIRGQFALNWQPSNFVTRNMYNDKDLFQAKAVILRDGIIESR